MGIKLTDAALERVRRYLAEQPDTLGLRFGVKRMGCSGWGYEVDMARAQAENDRVFEQDGRLLSQGTNQPAFRLLWQGGAEYRASFDTKVRLVFAEGEPAGEFTLHQGGAALQAVRKD